MATKRVTSLEDLHMLVPGAVPPEPKAASERDRATVALGLKLRVNIEKKGRGGKTVTVIAGFHHEREDLEVLAKELKVRCGTGGTVKDDVVELQGNHREAAVAFLKSKGFSVK